MLNFIHYTLLFILLLSTNVLAISTEKKWEKNPHQDQSVVENNKIGLAINNDKDITLLLAMGLDFLYQAPKNIKLNIFTSRHFEGYIMYNIPINKTHFVFSIGLGIQSNNYLFEKNNITLQRTRQSVIFDDIKAVIPSLNYKCKKSKLSLNYLNIPLEIKIATNPKDHKTGLTFVLGGNIGILVNAHTKIVYIENKITKKQKNHDEFQLNFWRYGVHMKIGYDNVAIIGGYTFSPVFQKSTTAPPGTQNMCAWNIGLALML